MKHPSVLVDKMNRAVGSLESSFDKMVRTNSEWERMWQEASNESERWFRLTLVYLGLCAVLVVALVVSVW